MPPTTQRCRPSAPTPTTPTTSALPIVGRHGKGEEATLREVEDSCGNRGRRDRTPVHQTLDHRGRVVGQVAEVLAARRDGRGFLPVAPPQPEEPEDAGEDEDGSA